MGLVIGDAAAMPTVDLAGKKVVNLSVAASAHDAEGKEVGWAEQTMNAPVGADGRFTGSVKMGLKPGKYSLKIGVVDIKGGKASLMTVPIEVPDFAQPQISGTLLILRQILDVPPNTPEDPSDPYSAFRLSSAQLVPAVYSELRKTDTVSFFFQVYDFQVDAAGKANGTARLRVMAEGKGQITGSAESPIDTPVFGTEIGPVPLEKFAPGKYTARVEATDKIAQKTISIDVPFQILP